MTSAVNPPHFTTPLPDHTQLPESDGTFVFVKHAGGKNFQEHPQSILLTDSIRPILQQRHQMLAANERGHYPISPLGIESGI